MYLQSFGKIEDVHMTSYIDSDSHAQIVRYLAFLNTRYLCPFFFKLSFL